MTRPSPALALVLLALVRSVLAQEAPVETGFLPKEDLGVLRWLEAHPEFDGRGVRVCVIDTGVDLLHPALRTTSAGRPKIVGYFNATDGADVDTSFVARAEPDGSLVGLSGRTLGVGSLAPDDGAWRLGLVRSADFFPGALDERLREQRRLRVETARRAGQAPGEDPGPVFDVVVFLAGGEWTVVVDTDEDGDLGDERPVRDFNGHREVASFPDEVHLGFGVEVGDEGDRTTFFFDAGGHGTHVAGIIGGWYGEGHPLNGVAPGVEILAAVCGNGRLDEVTSHNSIMKCIDWACANGADAINISFGGPSFFSDGREITAAFVDEAVARWSVPIVFSAGNTGPALFTVGSPGTSWRGYAIGAWAPARTQETNYGVVRPRRGDLFDFSSRGPLPNGRLGVDFLAPGSAISTMPTWQLVRGENMHGTSMAAPQATGTIALVLSGAKAAGWPRSEPTLRRALVEGARRIDHLLDAEQGAGLIQVPETFAALGRLVQLGEPVVWRMSADGDRSQGGLLVRGLPASAEGRVRRSIHVRPDLPRAGARDGAGEARAAFARLLRLETDAAWLAVPEARHVNTEGATIDVEIDRTTLPPGLSFAWVRATRVEDGALEFRIPVTVVLPEFPRAPGWRLEREFETEPGDRVSWWVRVPDGATRLRYSLLETGPDGNVYTIALGAPTSWTGDDLMWSSRTATVVDEEKSWIREVVGGEDVELAAFSRWQTNRPGKIRLGVEFFGAGGPTRVAALPGQAGVHWPIGATLGPVSVRVSGRVTHRLVEIPLVWTIDPDPRRPAVTDGEPLWLARGAGSFESPSGGAASLDFRRDSQFADWLDDTFVEVLGAEDRLVAAGMFWEGTFDLELPSAGRYRIAVVQSGRSRTMLERAGVLSPVLVLPIDGGEATVHRDAIDAWPEVDRREDRFALGASGKVSPYLLLPDTGEGLFRGRLLLEDADREVELLRAELVVDRRAPASDRAAVEERHLDLVRRELEEILADRRVDDGESGRVRDLLVRHRILEPSPRDRERLEVEAALAEGAADEDALPAARAIAASWLAAGEGAPALSADDRATRVQARLWAARIAARAGDSAAAARERAEALLLDPEARTLELDLELALARKDAKAALETARRLDEETRHHRWARQVVDLEIETGELDRAAARVAGWTARFPRRAAEAIELGRRLREARRKE